MNETELVSLAIESLVKYGIFGLFSVIMLYWALKYTTQRIAEDHKKNESLQQQVILLYQEQSKMLTSVIQENTNALKLTHEALTQSIAAKDRLIEAVHSLMLNEQNIAKALKVGAAGRGKK